MRSQTEVCYQVPALEELKELAATASAEYEVAKGSNPERKSFLLLVNHLLQDQTLMASEDAAKILLGAYVFELEHIGSSYHFKSLHSPENSELYKSLKKGLHLTDNKMSDELRLISVSAFYNYIKDRAPKELTQGTTWMVNDALRKPVLQEIKNLLKRLQPQINVILTSMPSYIQLQKILQNMEERYSKMPGGMWGKAHTAQAKFIDLINDYIATCLPQLDQTELDSLDPALKCVESYMLRRASAIFVMKTIENEWSLRSSLYQMVSPAISGSKTSDIDVESRIALLALLNVHITNMLENQKNFIKQKEQTNYKNVQAEFVKFQKMISDYQDLYHQEKTAPSNTHATMVLATSGVAQSGIQSVMRNVVGNAIPTPATFVVDTAAGAAGSMLLGPGGSIAAVAIARFVRSYIIPFAVAGICAGALDSVGNRIGEATTGVVAMPFKLTARGIKSLVNWYRNVEIDKNALVKNAELLEALVSLPDDAFPSEKKAKIENNYGIKISLTMGNRP